jgi:hypothetical protein
VYLKALTAAVETWAVPNEERARYWNGDESAHWLVHEERDEHVLAPFTGRLLTVAAIGRADRVVDVGCGTGSTTREVEYARLLFTQAHSIGQISAKTGVPKTPCLQSLRNVTVAPADAASDTPVRTARSPLHRPHLDLTNHGEVPKLDRRTR